MGLDVTLKVNSPDFTGVAGVNVALRKQFLNVLPPRVILAFPSCVDFVQQPVSRCIFKVVPQILVSVTVSSDMQGEQSQLMLEADVAGLCMAVEGTGD